jgi:photosystem I protein PsaO
LARSFLKGAWFQPLNLCSENLVSKFVTFTFNLYRYSLEDKFWLYMITWHMGLFSTMLLGQIGWQGTQQPFCVSSETVLPIT